MYLCALALGSGMASCGVTGSVPLMVSAKKYELGVEQGIQNVTKNGPRNGYLRKASLA